MNWEKSSRSPEKGNSMFLRIDNLSNLTKNQLIKPTPSQSSIYVFNKLISFLGLLNVHKVSEKMSQKKHENEKSARNSSVNF